MREIKFRVYSKTEKCFHYFTLANILQNEIEFQRHIINGDEFQQFTGLKDKNGKEIYEGDIILSNFYNSKDDEVEAVGIVKFCISNFCYYIEPVTSNYYGDLFFFTKLNDSNEAILIGNIHQNPELLNEVK